MSAGSMFMSGVASGAEMLGMKGLEHSARSTINAMKGGADFGNSILAAGAQRILDNEKLLSALGKSRGADGALNSSLTKSDLFKSMFYNKQGELQKSRVAAGIAGSYMGANVVGNGSLGIPFISTASWNR